MALGMAGAGLMRVRTLALFLGVVAGWASVPANAATRVVTKLDDTNDGTCDADCSLREAIDVALSGDAVTFGPDVRGTLLLTLGELVIDQPLTITGPGQAALTISGGDTQRILSIPATGALTASGLTFSQGKGQYDPGLGVEAAGVVINYSGSFAFTDCTFSDNHADGRYNTQVVNDAAVAYGNASGKTMSFTRCTFRDNTAGGGACLDIDAGTVTVTDSSFIDNIGDFGPACVIANSAATMTITGTTFTGNSARAGGAVFVSGSGGAVIKNTTIAANFSSSGFGAGVYVFNPVLVTLANVTLSGNSGTVGANVYLTSGGSALMRNTIVANASSNCGGTGTITSHGYNLDSGATCGFTAAGDKVNTPAGLGPLVPSGGKTKTMPLLANSAALDAGNPLAPGSGGDACEVQDQRAISRPQLVRCDIGAFESTGPETLGNSGFTDPSDKKNNYAWPAQSGVTQYQTRRSSTPGFAPPCVGITTSGTSWHDVEIPAPGGVFYYINRPVAPLTGTWGWNSAGAERTTACP